MGGCCTGGIPCGDKGGGEPNRHGRKGRKAALKSHFSFSFASFASSAVKRFWLIHARKQCSPFAREAGTGAQPDRHIERSGSCPPAQRRRQGNVRQRHKVTHSLA